MDIFAYLDPGTGSIVAQAVIGGAVALTVFLKAYWHKIRKLFGKGGKQSEDLRGEED